MEQQHQQNDPNEETRRQQAMQQEDGFNYDTFMRYLHDQEYQPAPHLVEDNRIGFDSDGNYHVQKNGANMDSPYTPNFTYRIASEIQQFVVGQAEMSDHDISLTDRYEIASAYLLHLIDQNAFTDDMVAFDALRLWQVQYGKDMRNG